MGSCSLKLLSWDMKTKTKNKDQPINNHKNNRKTKAMGNVTPIMDHYSRSGFMGDTNP